MASQIVFSDIRVSRIADDVYRAYHWDGAELVAYGCVVAVPYHGWRSAIFAQDAECWASPEAAALAYIALPMAERDRLNGTEEEESAARSLLAEQAPAQVVTPSGIQYMLPGETPPPAKVGAATVQQRFF